MRRALSEPERGEDGGVSCCCVVTRQWPARHVIAKRFQNVGKFQIVLGTAHGQDLSSDQPSLSDRPEWFENIERSPFVELMRFQFVEHRVNVDATDG